jgi:hypothetical protein
MGLAAGRSRFTMSLLSGNECSIQRSRRRGLKKASWFEARDPGVAKGGSVMENLVLQSDVPSEYERSRRPGDESLRQWARTEHHRLHCAEGWPDSPYKEAVLAATRSALKRLEMAAFEPFDSLACMVCATRRNQARKVLVFPSRPKGSPVIVKPAA